MPQRQSLNTFLNARPGNDDVQSLAKGDAVLFHEGPGRTAGEVHGVFVHRATPKTPGSQPAGGQGVAVEVCVVAFSIP